MNQLPTDPLSTQSYTYTRINDDSYQLTSLLENAGDNSAAKSQVQCGSVRCDSDQSLHGLS